MSMLKGEETFVFRCGNVNYFSDFNHISDIGRTSKACEISR
jgi:hypothetical protein